MKADSSISLSIRQSIINAVSDLGITEKSVRIVVGVSGGIDSHVLLHLLHASTEELALELIVCHVNHGLREESEEEEAFVKMLAKLYQVSFVRYQAPAWDRKTNLEAWARAVRYQFFYDCLKEHDAQLIVTAHHQNDQAETALMRMISGRMLTVSHGVSLFDKKRQILRPLLHISRSEIEEYAQASRLQYVYDTTNEDLARTRNRIRHELIPNLKKAYNPRVVENLADLQERFSEDEKVLQQQAVQLFDEQGEKIGQREQLLKHPFAIRWRLLLLLAQKQTQEQTGNVGGKLGYRSLRRLDQIIQSRERAQDIGFGIRAGLNEDECVCFRVQEQEFSDGTSEAEPSAQVLAIPGRIQHTLSDGQVIYIEAKLVQLNQREKEALISQVTHAADAGADAGEDFSAATAFFDAEALQNKNALVVRQWQFGDTMDVWKRGTRKVKKLFQERHISEALRRQVPIVELERDILWIPGVARGAQAPVDSSTNQVLELRCHQG